MRAATRLQRFTPQRSPARTAPPARIRPSFQPERYLTVDEERVVERESVTTASPTPVSPTPVAPTPESAAPVYADQTVSGGTVVTERVRRSPSGAETARRAIVFLFGLVQALIGIRCLPGRIVDAAEAHSLDTLSTTVYDRATHALDEWAAGTVNAVWYAVA